MNEETPILKQEKGEDGKTNLIFDVDELKRRLADKGSMVEFEDSHQGISIKMLSTEMDMESLTNLAAATLNFIKTSRTIKNGISYIG